MLKMHPITLLYILLIIGSRGKLNSSVNAKLFTFPLPAITTSTCPSQKDIETLHKRFNEKFTGPCGGAGWTRVAYLNMADPQQTCPSTWKLNTSPVRGCGRSSTIARTCESVVYPVNGRSYSTVCGKIIAYQKGVSLGFWWDGEMEAVLSGISITHGPPGARQHIWTFVGAQNERDPKFNGAFNCPCSDTSITRSFATPTFIGNDYFCDSGGPGPGYNSWTFYLNNPLWDGEGCGPTSSCCEFNSPPWFLKTLPEPTTDGLEMRLCGQNPFQYEDKIITSIDIYIR